MARHYLDHASTTPTRPEAVAAMTAWLERGVAADPGRLHQEGRAARLALEDAREQVAGLFGARPREVVFTSGGTESINAAVWGAVRLRQGPVVCAHVEHSAVRDSSARTGPLETVAVDHLGRIEVEAVEDALDRCRQVRGADAALVHCQWANHEVGTVQPVAEIVELCRGRGVMTHVDAVAAAGHVPCRFDDLGADLVSVSSHKLGGPAGIGALFVRRGLRVDPFVVGGEQERARRGGLEHVAGAIGFGAATSSLTEPDVLPREAHTARELTDRLAAAALAVEGVEQFGDPVDRLPHLLCLGIEGIEAEPVLLGLDQHGVAVHSGSSCSSESLEPSPVLEAMGVPAERSLRLSVGWSTTASDIEAFETWFPSVVEHLRALRT